MRLVSCGFYKMIKKSSPELTYIYFPVLCVLYSLILYEVELKDDTLNTQVLSGTYYKQVFLRNLSTILCSSTVKLSNISNLIQSTWRKVPFAQVLNPGSVTLYVKKWTRLWNLVIHLFRRTQSVSTKVQFPSSCI